MKQRGDPSSTRVLATTDLVDRRAVLLGHLVELVDEAEPAVGEHERAALERPLARQLVAVHARREPDRRRALARRVHGARRDLLGVLEQLRLGRARVAEQEHLRSGARATRSPRGAAPFRRNDRGSAATIRKRER